MDPVYVIGHRNPDTDSIVSAMAYAALRNACGQREYVAGRLGQISAETRIVLNRFGFEPPKLIHDMYTQVRDLDFDRPPVLGSSVTVGRAWEIIQQENCSSVPVGNDDGTLYGMLSREDVAGYYMTLVNLGVLSEVPLFNVLSVLEGKILNEAGEMTDTVAGEIVIALPQQRENLLFNRQNSIVLCGWQPDMMRRALDMNVRCLILCQAELPQELRNYPTKTCIVSTPFDAYQAARMIFQAIPIERICSDAPQLCFHLEDRVDEVRERVVKHRQPNYPILNEKEQVVGVLSRQHLLRPRRKRVVLVDHNEASQSVPGLEETEILAIVDHHRLADIQTTNPIYVRNEPVGSTNTIIAGMFQDLGLLPSEKMAGMMAAAILSDTVMFKSPTCTQRDIKTAERMARIANVSLDALGKEIFSADLEGKTARELLKMDYKEFLIGDNALAVSQITCTDSAAMLQRKEEFLGLMQEMAREQKLSMVLLMITDVLQEGTALLFVGDQDIIRQAFNAHPRDNIVFLPRVMSRKKQVIPMLSDLWG